MAGPASKYYTRLTIGPYIRDNAFGLSHHEERLIVYLPLPTDLRDDTTVSYNPVNLETIGDALQNRENLTDAAVLRNIGSLAQMGMGATSAGLSQSMAGRGPGLATLAGLAGGALLSAGQALLPAEQISSAMQQQTGAAPNPNPSVQFQGPVLRDFTFDWAFYPKNKNESKNIDILIRRLKARALPSENSSGGAILNYPHICQLNFYPWDSNGKGNNGWSANSIIKIKKCFMSGVNVNYNAYGTPGFFEDTQLPISYRLSISFKEIEYLLSKDWDPEGETAAKERQPRSTTAASIVAATFNEVVPTLGNILVDTFNTGLDLLTGNLLDQTDRDNYDNMSAAFRALKPGSKVTFNAEGNGTTQPSGEYNSTLTAAGKYVLVFQQKPDTGKEFKAYEPVTKGTFDTVDDLNQYLLKEKIVGPVTFPPPPKAAAAAPG
jgi:hypothetical protein